MEKGLTEEMLLDLTKEIGNHEGLQKLGIKLKFSLLEMIEFEKVNKKNPFEGTVHMVSKWRKDTETKKQIPLLKAALMSTGLKGVARSFFKVLDKESEKQKEKLRRASGNEKEAGKSTAIADKKPAQPAQKGSKTTETKPTSGASTSTTSTSAGINAGKEPAKRKKKPEGNNTPNKKIRTTTAQDGLSVKVEASGSATIRNVNVTGQKVKTKGNAKK